MLKVLHVRSSAGFWGPDRQILQLIRPLRERGVDIEVMVLYRRPDGGPALHLLVERAREQGARAGQLVDTRRWARGAFVAIGERLQSGGYHLVHTHDYKSNLLGGWPARQVGLPAVASVRGYTDRTFALRVYKWFDLAVTLRRFTRIVAVSEAVRRQVLRAGYPAHRVLTMHDAIDTALFSPSAIRAGGRVRQALGCAADDLLVCAVGRLSPEKGHGHLLTAFERVVAALPEARLVIVGDGPLRSRLQQQAARRRLSGRVIFTGYRSDVEHVIGACDLLVMPSLREGFGDPVIEAMALGKPVVASRVGGIVEVVQDEVSGLLVPPGNPETLAQAVVTLLREPATRQRMGREGRQVVLKSFSVESLADRLAALYRELASPSVSKGCREEAAADHAHVSP